LLPTPQDSAKSETMKANQAIQVANQARAELQELQAKIKLLGISIE
jgi:hypothetical protein